jgi:HEPN domain-containing protein
MKAEPEAEGQRWLEQAEADYAAIQVLFEAGIHHLACFVSQQVAEKALKAFLYAQGEEVVVGHSVERLCRWATEYDADYAAIQDIASPLDGYYVPTRYPNGLPESIPARVYTRSASENAMRLAQQVLDLARRKLR